MALFGSLLYPFVSRFARADKLSIFEFENFKADGLIDFSTNGTKGRLNSLSTAGIPVAFEYVPAGHGTHGVASPVEEYT